MKKTLISILCSLMILFSLSVLAGAKENQFTEQDLLGAWVYIEKTDNSFIERYLNFYNKNNDYIYVYVENENNSRYDRQEGNYEVKDGKICFSAYTQDATSISDVAIINVFEDIMLVDSNANVYEKADKNAESKPEKESEKKSEEKKDKSNNDFSYTGTGDSVVTLDSFDDWHIYVIDGNAGSDYFGVIAYDAGGNRIGSLVNTTEVYHGVVFDSTQSAKVLEVKATGSWSIRMVSIYTADYALKGDTITGKGDDVIIFYTDDGTSLTAKINGNSGEDFFGVIAYDGSGRRIGSLVNTTDAYSGTVMLKNEPRIFEVKAEGNWSITFE